MRTVFAQFVGRVVVPFLYWNVSHGRAWVVLAVCHADVRNSAEGDSAMGGLRHTRRAYAEWFRRLYRLTSPIRSTVVVRWVDPVRAVDGTLFENRGTHTLQLRFGRIVTVHQAWNADMVRAACQYAVSLGLDEAAQGPILDTAPRDDRKRLV